MTSAPIGIYDSGVGGLSVLKEIKALLPGESIEYVGDSLHAPWGDKPADFVERRGLALGRFLVARGAKLVVVASNTGTAGSADALRATLPVPVVAMEPGIKPAVAATRTGVVGVIVTATMIGSVRMASLLDRFSGNVKVLSAPVPGLVEHVEAGDLQSEELRAKVEAYIRPLIDAGADTLVLGSTHYVFLRPLIAEVAGPGVTLIDTGAAVARRVAQVLEELGIAAPPDAAPRETFLTSGDPETGRRVMSLLLGREVAVSRLPE